MYFVSQENEMIHIMLAIILVVMLNIRIANLTGVSNSSSCLTAGLKPNIETGRKLDLFPLKFFKEISPKRCYEECWDHGDCLSVNYHRLTFYCELLNQKKRDNNPLLEEKDYVYMELNGIIDQANKTCGMVSCNHYSKCVFTSSNTSSCIETDCSESYPVLKNGYVNVRTFSPMTASYACHSGYYGVGSDKISCKPGGQWTSLGYRCEPPVHGGWGSWTDWSTCSKTCNTGSQYRNRSCNNPSPKYGGNGCGYASAESTACNTDSCPTD